MKTCIVNSKGRLEWFPFETVKAVPCAVDPTWTFCFYIRLYYWKSIKWNFIFAKSFCDICILSGQFDECHVCPMTCPVTRLWCDVLLCSDTRLIDVMSWHKQELELLVQSFSNRYFYYYFYWPNISLNCNHFLLSLPQRGLHDKSRSYVLSFISQYCENSPSDLLNKQKTWLNTWNYFLFWGYP